MPAPPYPDYVSGHACITGAATNTFRYLFGRRGLDLVVPSLVQGVPDRAYTTTAGLDEQAKNGRIWLGLHFRTAMTDGNRLGHLASQWGISHAFQECH